MLDALVAGTTDPAVLAELARGTLRKKIPALRQALEGRFDPEHTLMVGRILAHIDFLDESIAELSQAIEEQLGPFAAAVELLSTIPGVARRTAEVIIAETGGDMSVFPTAKHLASWAGVCPGNDESAGKRRLAVAHSILVACWHMLQTGEIYNDPGGDYFTRRDPERRRRRLVTQLQRLGYTVTLQEAADAA